MMESNRILLSIFSFIFSKKIAQKSSFWAIRILLYKITPWEEVSQSPRTSQSY